jgi:hypothetical protein
VPIVKEKKSKPKSAPKVEVEDAIEEPEEVEKFSDKDSSEEV